MARAVAAAALTVRLMVQLPPIPRRADREWSAPAACLRCPRLQARKNAPTHWRGERLHRCRLPGRRQSRSGLPHCERQAGGLPEQCLVDRRERGAYFGLEVAEQLSIAPGGNRSAVRARQRAARFMARGPRLGASSILHLLCATMAHRGAENCVLCACPPGNPPEDRAAPGSVIRRQVGRA